MKVARRLAFQPYRSAGSNGTTTTTNGRRTSSTDDTNGSLLDEKSEFRTRVELQQELREKRKSQINGKQSGKQSFDAALADFRESLPTEDERKLSMTGAPDPSAVVEFTSQLNEIKGRRVKECSKRVMPFLKAMKGFSDVVDTYVQSDPVISGLVWGSAKYVILVAFNFFDYVEKLSNMFLQLSNLCPVYERFEKLFSASDELRDSIYAFYAITLRFCRDVVIFINESRIKKLTKALWKDLKSQFVEVEGELSKQQELVDMEIKFASDKAAQDERVASALFRDESRGYMRHQLQHNQNSKEWRLQKDAEAKKARWDTLLSKVCDYNYSSTFLSYRERRHEDTGAWLYDTEEFSEWNDQGKTKGLWCHGIPGCGKSLLTVGLVDHLFSGRQGDVFISYFFCTYSDPDSLIPRNIIGSLIKQLLIIMGHETPGLEKEVASVFDSKQFSRPEASRYFAFFSQLVSQISGDVYVIIDGLDECKDRDRQLVLSTLRRILKKPGADLVFKLVITSRSELDIRNALQDFVQLEFTPERNDSDIRKYVEFEIGLCPQLEELEQDLIEEIISGISKRAKGMFVLVYLLVQELCVENDIDSIKGVLQSLPDELNEIFDRILLRISKERKLAVAMKIFSWLMCARRTLTLAELAEAVSVTPNITQWSERQKQLDNIKMLQNCGPLVVHNRHDDTVQLAHYTVQEYLLSLASTELRIDPQQANLEIAQVCLTYLGFSDFKTALAEIPKEKKAVARKDMKFDAVELVNTATTSNRHVRRLSQALLNRKRPVAAVDTKKLFMLEDPEKPREPEDRGYATLCKTYRLLDYAASYWVFHCEDLKSEDGWVWNAFRKLATNETEPGFDFSVCPWGKDKVIKDKTYDLRPLEWALKNDHAALVRLYLDVFYVQEGSPAPAPAQQELLQIWLPSSEDGGEHPKRPLQIACAHGSESVVRLLIEAGGDVNYRSDEGYTLLQIAANGGHVGVVDVLLEYGADVNALAEKRSPYTALQGAASAGHLTVVRTLLENGADVDAEESEFGRTALHGAVLNQHLEVVEELLTACTPASIISRGWLNAQTPLEIAAESGSLPLISAMLDTIELFSLDDKTAELVELQLTAMLHIAAKAGHLDVVEYLLIEQGVDANSRDGYKRTPLLSAILYSQREIVNLLLANGADPNAPVLSMNGINAIQAAAKVGDTIIINTLLNAGADVNAQWEQNDGLTALRFAASWGQMEAFEMLIAAGANVNAQGTARKGPQTALESAVKEGQLSILNRLLQAGAKIFRPDALIMAAERGSLEIFQALCTHHQPPREQLHEALRHAAFNGHIDVVEYLLDKKVDVNDRGSYPRGVKPFGNKCLVTALQCAAGAGRRGVVERLLRAKADVNARAATEEGRTALAAAAEIGHALIVTKLIKAKAHVNAPAGGVAGGRTALQAAAEFGHIEVAELLINHGANINAAPSDVDGRTALQAAAESGHSEMVSFLIERKADVNAAAGYRGGRTALQAAAERGYASIVEMLVQKGAHVNALAGEWKGKTALQAAAACAWFNVVTKLLEHGADVNAPPATRDGQTAVHCAAGAGFMPIQHHTPLSPNFPTDVSVALSSSLSPNNILRTNDTRRGSTTSNAKRTSIYTGPDPSSDSDEDDLPVHRSPVAAYVTVLRLLLSKGGDPNARSTLADKGTPLHLAAEYGHLSIVGLLLQYGADREAINMNGKTAVEVAMERNHGEVVERILRDIEGDTVGVKDKEKENWNGEEGREVERFIVPEMKRFLVPEVPKDTKKDKEAEGKANERRPSFVG